MTGIPDSLDGKVGLFFVVRDIVFLHSCELSEGEPYGDFITYPFSHYQIWDECYYKKYHVDFDYFPRGRIVYNKVEAKYTLYYDGCVEDTAKEMQNRYLTGKSCISRDEHYQCHGCNSSYIS